MDNPSVSFSETSFEAILAQCTELKVRGLESMQCWDLCSKESLAFSREVIESIGRGIEKTLAISSNQIGKTSAFFGRIKFRIDEGDSLNSLLDFLCESPELVSTTRELSAAHTGLSSKLETFHRRVRTEVVGRELVENLRPAERELALALASVAGSKGKIKKFAEAGAAGLSDFADAFRAAKSSNLRGRRSKENCLDSVIAFASGVALLSESISLYWTHTRKLLSVSSEIRLARTEALTRALRTYSSIVVETIGGTLNPPQALNRPPSPFDLTAWLPPVQRSKLAPPNRNIEVEDIDSAVDKGKTPSAAEIIRAFCLRRYEGHLGLGAEQCPFVVYISTDLFVSGYKQPLSPPTAQPPNAPALENRTTMLERVSEGGVKVFSVQVEKIELKEKKSQGAIEFCYKEKGFLWDSAKTTKVYFNIDEMERVVKDVSDLKSIIEIANKERKLKEAGPKELTASQLSFAPLNPSSAQPPNPKEHIQEPSTPQPHSPREYIEEPSPLQEEHPLHEVPSPPQEEHPLHEVPSPPQEELPLPSQSPINPDSTLADSTLQVTSHQTPLRGLKEE